MKDLVKKQEEELDKILGEVPAILSGYENEVCFVCGQPFDKSSQAKELKDFISKVRKETTEYVCDEFSKWRRGMHMQCKDVDTIEKANDQLERVKKQILDNLQN